MNRRFRGSSSEKNIHKTPNMKIDSKELKTIKIEIKRKIHGNSESKELDHSLDRPEEIKIYRCRGEGSRPIFDRSDVIVNKEETECRTVLSHSPFKSPIRCSSERDHSAHRDRNSPKQKNLNRSRESPKHNRNTNSSPHRDKNIPSSSRHPGSSSRNRSRSRESIRGSRRSRSRSRSSRREFGRRRNSRSPNDRDRRRYERSSYGHFDRDRKHGRTRSPSYSHSSSRRRSRSPPHVAPINPTALGAFPLIIPPDLGFYRPEDTVWFQAPLRPPILVPRGFMPPGGMYRPPRPPIPRYPYMPPRQPQFRQIRPVNRTPRLP